MALLQQLAELNTTFGIWYYNTYLRVTFVSKHWLVVWDHRQQPPARYDCKATNHRETCMMTADKLEELATR